MHEDGASASDGMKLPSYLMEVLSHDFPEWETHPDLVEKAHKMMGLIKAIQSGIMSAKT